MNFRESRTYEVRRIRYRRNSENSILLGSRVNRDTLKGRVQRFGPYCVPTALCPLTASSCRALRCPPRPYRAWVQRRRPECTDHRHRYRPKNR